MSDYEFRFGGIGRLYGAAALARLRSAHVVIVGLGGVGSWAAEALARTGVGRLTLVDLDEVCVSNVNRQVPALDGQIGRAKVEVMAERLRAIAPELVVDARLEFYTETSAERLLPPGGPQPNVVIDAIDAVANKVRLIAQAHRQGIPVVICGGAGGRRDPTQVRISDLSEVTHDRLTREVRKRLRQEHGFPRGEKKFHLDCVWSMESPVFPQKDGTVCAVGQGEREPGESGRLNCDWGFGSAAFVTGTFGFAAASRAIDRITRDPLSALPGGSSPNLVSRLDTSPGSAILAAE